MPPLSGIPRGAAGRNTMDEIEISGEAPRFPTTGDANNGADNLKDI